MSSINLNYYQYNELVKICWKAFNPIDAFMSCEDLVSVIDHFHLRNGSFFPLPIFLDIDNETKNRVKKHTTVSLIFDNKKVGNIVVNDIYRIKKKSFCKKIFGTNSTTHPGVKFFLNTKEWFVGGKVSLIKSSCLDEEITELKPSETKKIFKKKKWKTVVGFQTRNIPHKAHEYLHRVALEFVDGLYINPFIGWKKKGDYTPKAISTGYEYYVKNFINSDRVCLNLSRMNMRYAGPRESLFHALIRRNYGCTHFIIGRDHAGVGDFYGAFDAQDIFDSIPEDALIIKIFKADHTAYSKKLNKVVMMRDVDDHSKEDFVILSGTKVREMLSKGESLPKEFARPEVAEVLMNHYMKE